jgi:putative hemolysin
MPLFVPAAQTIATLLESFKRTGKHLAMVTDERDRFLGLVTLVDVLEAIVGEMPTLEERLKPEARRREDGSWLVDGRFDHRQLLKLLTNTTEADDALTVKETVAAFIGARLGAGAKEGDVLDANGWKYEVLDLDGERIDKVLVTPEELRP